MDFAYYTVNDVWQVAFGGVAKPVPVPEIYGQTNAAQWANLSLYAHSEGSPYAIPAALTTWQACIDKNDKTGVCKSPNTPIQSWQELMDALSSLSVPVQNILYSTDITYQN